jgi:glycosyltransferase involved in cell wall biosynthesis
VASVSILTPSYNQGNFIRETIESVLRQEVRDLDYLIVDGGSTDNTVETLRSFGKQIRWISEPDHGIAEALNKGLSRSLGEIVGWLNSDDIYNPGAVQAVLDFFTAHPDVDVVYGDADHIDEDGRVIGRYPTEPFSVERLRETCFISQPATFFRRSLLEQHGFLSEKFPHCIDYELWIRFAKGGARFEYLPRPLAATRLHSAAKTIALRLECHKDINDILRCHFGKVPTTSLLNYAYAAIAESGLQPRDHLRYAVAVARHAVAASFRWNRGITLDLCNRVAQWLIHGFLLEWRTRREKQESTAR